MKKIYSILLALTLVFCFTACSNSGNTKTEENASAQSDTQQESNNGSAAKEGSKALVIYFSCTGNTEEIAKAIQSKTNSDIFEIAAKNPYTAKDLDYNDNNCRANREMQDESARPEIDNRISNLDSYDTVFIGYPIWRGTCPRIINTLLDTYDFSGKTVIPFCTSGGSGISKSVSVIKAAEPDADVREGIRVNDISELNAWLESQL